MTSEQTQNVGDKNNVDGDDDFICGVIEGFYGKPWTFKQRKDLFKRLKEFNLNSFMYAPKDDTKHRSNWRQLYDETEAKELKSLIKEANDYGIDFYYSLAPGLDMIYSQQAEVDLVIRKYDQLVGLGCKSFAILFDDIEPSLINDKDKDVFDNYANAQVCIANKIYDHLKRPKFFFCPTEYCESRAVPNVTNSVYLNTIGRDLNSGIDFMWSGSRVISRLITEENIELLTKVIRRRPVIWENLHANDYDKKRVFLGPYSGRSTKIIPKIKGVMTNPNCEYEANFIAIHTLAQWRNCNHDINLDNKYNSEGKILHAIQPPSSTLPLLEPSFSRKSSNLTEKTVYNPEKALAFAIKDWLPHLFEQTTIPLKTQVIERNDAMASIQIAKEENISDVDLEGNVEMLNAEEETPAQEQQQSTTTTSVDDNKQQDCNAEVIDDSCEMPDAVDVATTTTSETSKPSGKDECVMCSFENNPSISSGLHGTTNNKSIISGDYRHQNLADLINFENLSLLVDLFFLPFDHGFHGCALLKDIKWLKDNSDVVLETESSSSSSSEQQQPQDIDGGKQDEVQMRDVNDDVDIDQEMEPTTANSWLEKADKLNNFCAYISRLVNNLIYDCPNKLLIIELYPYLNDVRDVTSLITEYIKFLRFRKSPLDCFYYTNAAKQNKANSSSIITSEEQEPWVNRGGLIGDVQRLLST